MKKILFYARDPGAANCVIPVYKKCKRTKGFQTVLWGKDFALDLYKKDGLIHEDIKKLALRVDKNGIKKVLVIVLPDVVVSGVGSNDLTDRFLWLAAKKLKIPVIVILDQWQNYKMRFSLDPLNSKDCQIDVLPDKICVMDEFAKREMIKNGFPPGIIEITGQPYFEEFIENKKKVTSREIKGFRKKIGMGWNDFLITFASEPMIESYEDRLFWGYNQLTILADVIKCINRISKIEKRKNFFLLIKLHPRNDKKLIENFLKNISFSINFKIIVLKEVASFLAISASDLVIGMSSMFLLESILLNKPVLSVQTGLKRENPFVLSRIGYIETILSPLVLYKEIKKIIDSRFNKILHLSFPKHPASNIIKIIEKLV